MDRIQQRAQQTQVPAETLQLRKLGRKLTAVCEELADYSDKIQLFMNAPEHEWEALVLKHQTSLTSEFFHHVGRMVQASANDPRRREGESMSCASAVAAWASTLAELKQLCVHHAPDMRQQLARACNMLIDCPQAKAEAACRPCQPGQQDLDAAQCLDRHADGYQRCISGQSQL